MNLTLFGVADNAPWLELYPTKFIGMPEYADALSAFRDGVRTGRGTISYFGNDIGYAKANIYSDNLAGWLHGEGIRAGDRIAIILQNVPDFVFMVIAAWKLGAIPIPINPMYRAQELAKIFSDCRPAAAICHDGHELEVVRALGTDGENVRIILSSAVDQALSPDFRIVPDVTPGQHYTRSSDIISHQSTWTSTHHVQPSDTGLLLYTSGTTGVPKGVVLTHHSIVTNAQSLAAWASLKSDGRVLAIAPLFHITGFISNLIVAIVAQCRIILHYRFEPQVVLDIIRQERPTFTIGAITAFNALLQTDASIADFSSFHTVFSGGAPIAPALRQRIATNLGVTVQNAYGMTETCSITHAAPPGVDIPVDSVTGALSIGIPFLNTTAIVIDEDGRRLPPGEIGEICMSGPQIMKEYWGKQAESNSALAGGFMHSGDIGFMDRAGWFYLVDRKKDMINASGFKVWPREIEEILLAHENVRDAAVIGVPHAYRGETVFAFVVSAKPAIGDGEILIDYCRELLAAYKCPRVIRFLDELPKSAAGKVLKGELRELAVASSVN